MGKRNLADGNPEAARRRSNHLENQSLPPASSRRDETVAEPAAQITVTI